MTKNSIRLSARLMAVAGFIEDGADVADIGTDHGYLPVYLAQSGLAGRIFASDISADSLRSALRSAEKYGVADKISFVVAPGLAGIGETEVDTIVISGLGGETISQILARESQSKIDSVRLILQPQTKTGRLCSWLSDNGYSILDAKLARDDGRLYVIILAGNGAVCLRGERTEESGESAVGILSCADPVSSILNSSEPDKELLHILAGKCDPLFAEYIDVLISSARRAAEGMARSGEAGYPLMMKRLEVLGALDKLQCT